MLQHVSNLSPLRYIIDSISFRSTVSSPKTDQRAWANLVHRQHCVGVSIPNFAAGTRAAIRRNRRLLRLAQGHRAANLKKLAAVLFCQMLQPQPKLEG